MPAVVVVLFVAVAFFLGYRFYSRYLAEKVYTLQESFVTPAHEFRDGIDYVPTNKHVLFGHHFVSVAGAAPIVGPAIGVFWGWGPALAWVVLGSIFASGAHDFGSIVVSVRNKAQNIGTLTQNVINPRSRTLFLLIIFFLLTLVNAVFSIVIANLFMANPAVVLPILLEIPIAIVVGQIVYRQRTAALVPSIVGVVVLYASIPLGRAFPIEIDWFADMLGLETRTTWVILLFLYAGIASRIPVWVLLQPRDYINSHQLFIALGAIALGIIIGMNEIVAPMLNRDIPADSPNWFPFLFVTIACGAISGFHSLVSSGTTSKQLDKETDARYVGYMGSMGEGSLAVGAILATTAGIAIVGLDWNTQYATFADAGGGAVGNFVQGVAGFTSNFGIPLEIGTIFAALVVISFAATTMDSGVRLQRYIFQEIGGILGIRWMKENLNLVTILAVVVPLALAWDADLAFGRLWTLFGTTNQLTAGLALAVIAVWVLRRRLNPLAQIIPLAFLLVMTTWALILQFIDLVDEGDWLLVVLDAAIFVLAVWLIIEAVGGLLRAKRDNAALAASGPGADVEASAEAGPDAGAQPDRPDPTDRE
jgi:carbon starvation protein